jgi:GDP-L-fucose synthase
MNPQSRIYIAGHRGLVGSAIVRHLQKLGYHNLILRTHHETDLTSPEAVNQLFAETRPEYVILAAAKVGGILANSQYPADFIRSNLAIQLNVVEACAQYRVNKLEFLGSSCIYPKLAPQPIKEEYLLTGPLEPTNEWYAIAKIAGIKLCQAYRIQRGLNAISLMPTNLYGPGDNFNLDTSHVLPALIRKFHTAKLAGSSEVVIWGTGTPMREFLHVDDLAAAAVFLLENYDEPEIINVGTGEDITIRQLAETVSKIAGFQGKLVFDTTKPDGSPRKLLDVTRIHQIGWHHQISLEQGIQDTYNWYVANLAGRA